MLDQAVTAANSLPPSGGDESEETLKTRNLQRWREWHERNRAAYNKKRRDAARDKAHLKRVQKQSTREEPGERRKTLVLHPSSPELVPASCRRHQQQLPLYFWTREYNPAAASPRQHQWREEARRIRVHALMSHSSST